MTNHFGARFEYAAMMCSQEWRRALSARVINDIDAAWLNDGRLPFDHRCYLLAPILWVAYRNGRLHIS